MYLLVPTLVCNYYGIYYGNYYGVFFLKVFRYKIFSDCSQYSSCDSCASIKDPVCGWCVLENKCSRALMCNSSELIGRWINSHKQCIVNVSLSNKFTTIEWLSNVSSWQKISRLYIFCSTSKRKLLRTLYSCVGHL